MKYQDISLEEFIALTQTHKVVIFGTGKLFQRAMPRLLSQGMKLDHIRLLMDNGSAGKNVTADRHGAFIPSKKVYENSWRMTLF